jgi:hypothetical protein
MRSIPRLAAAVALASTPLVAHAQDGTPLPLRVRLYTASGAGGVGDGRALDEAAAILGEAGVAPRWIACRSAHASTGDPSCSRSLAFDEVIIRLVVAPPRPQRGAAAASGHFVAPVTLGDALVDPRLGRGALATIYSDRVSWLSHTVGVSFDRVLGRAVAHEIGHLLLGTSEHAPRGLMRALWTPDELKDDRPSDWRFGAAERQRIRRAVHARLSAR